MTKVFHQLPTVSRSAEPDDLLACVDGTSRNVKVKNFWQEATLAAIVYTTTGVVTTTSQTYESMGMPEKEVSLEIGQKVLLTMQMQIVSNGSNFVFVDCLLRKPDNSTIYLGESIGASSGQAIYGYGSSYIRHGVGRFVYTAAATGTHAFQPVWRVTGGTGYAYVGPNSRDSQFTYSIGYA